MCPRQHISLGGRRLDSIKLSPKWHRYSTPHRWLRLWASRRVCWTLSRPLKLVLGSCKMCFWWFSSQGGGTVHGWRSRSVFPQKPSAMPDMILFWMVRRANKVIRLVQKERGSIVVIAWAGDKCEGRRPRRRKEFMQSSLFLLSWSVKTPSVSGSEKDAIKRAELKRDF